VANFTILARNSYSRCPQELYIPLVHVRPARPKTVGVPANQVQSRLRIVGEQLRYLDAKGPA
jgi:hypothetical protein